MKSHRFIYLHFSLIEVLIFDLHDIIMCSIIKWQLAVEVNRKEMTILNTHSCNYYIK
jgi:hypothetical protein